MVLDNHQKVPAVHAKLLHRDTAYPLSATQLTAVKSKTISGVNFKPWAERSETIRNLKLPVFITEGGLNKP
jgi:hypothetical protein